MGTNYYLVSNDSESSEPRRLRHIGKSSGGWCFSLHVYPDEGINTLDDWFLLFNAEDLQIVDEYGTRIHPDEMITRITEREGMVIDWDAITHNSFYNYTSKEEFLKKNHAEEGPNNLLRHKVDGNWCIANGEGTWDYLVGDFC